MSARTPVRRALDRWVDRLTVRVRGPELDALAARPGMDSPDPAIVVRVMVEAARAAMAEREAVLARADALRAAATRLEGAALRGALERHIRGTVSGWWAARGDLSALGRDLDAEALLDREADAAEAAGSQLEVVLHTLGGMLFGAAAEGGDPRALIEGSGAHALMREVAASDPRAATRRAAVRALADVTSAWMSNAGGSAALDPDGLRLLRRLLVDPNEDPLVRRAAVRVCAGLQSGVARRWLTQAVGLEEGERAFLVRAAAVETLLGRPERWATDVARLRLRDHSELVRQTLAIGLARRVAAGEEGAKALLAVMVASDAEPRVRARAADALGGAGPLGADLLAGLLRDEPLVATFAAGAVRALVDAGVPLPPVVYEALERARQEAPPAVARRAASALLAARVSQSPAWPVAVALSRLERGMERRVRLAAGTTALDLAEALVPAAESGHGFWLVPDGSGWVKVRRGDELRPTMWRLLHELRNPSPIKRQGADHVLGRVDLGPLRVPPRGLCEEAPTGIPGQRVREDKQDGWAPELPLIDDYLHATSGQEVTVVSAEGTTVIEPPRGWVERMRARARITWRYAALDTLRLETLGAESHGDRRTAFVRGMDGLGFRTMHNGGGPWQGFFASFADPVTYLVSLGANALGHLVVVVAALTAILFGRMIAARARIARWRAAVPLVIGGWGTRGKSGTERLKAALFQGVGVPFVAKTTGCEAMVLRSRPNGRSTELFLYRPYDKATVWEQHDVMRLAAQTGSRALLWECMALRPAYVDILQTWWMRDDLSTLTNAYPDHEDIQGPTGMDVAEVLAGFSPPDALVLTTEENMLPVLQEVAQKRGSAINMVRRADRDLVPGDLLSLLPYEEHRSNVALAMAVAAQFDVEPVDAVVLMARHVVPDLGALAIFPRARYRGRDVEFVNGMSANDELSFRHNWRRAGFESQDDRSSPGVVLVTVVNNRADRVARSRVFASILANRAGARHHVVIGTNIRGFQSYFEAEVDGRLDRSDLADTGVVDELARHVRVVDPGQLGVSLALRLGAPEAACSEWEVAAREHVEESTATTLGAGRSYSERLRAQAEQLADACELGPVEGLVDALLDEGGRAAALHGARREGPAALGPLFRAMMLAALVVVDDAGVPGDVLIERVVDLAPPGALVRVMGVQNIKGTGLDFAYQWVEWRELRAAIDEMWTGDLAGRRAAVNRIADHPLRSALVCEAAEEALIRAAEDLEIRAAATGALEVVRRRMREREQQADGRRGGRAMRPLLYVLERLLDPFDAIVRRRSADRVLSDLAARRIGLGRAQSRLKDVTIRQKGGWLTG